MNTQIQILKVWLKTVLPLLKYFSVDCFYWCALHSCVSIGYFAYHTSEKEEWFTHLVIVYTLLFTVWNQIVQIVFLCSSPWTASCTQWVFGNTRLRYIVKFLRFSAAILGEQPFQQATTGWAKTGLCLRVDNS